MAEKNETTLAKMFKRYENVPYPCKLRIFEELKYYA